MRIRQAERSDNEGLLALTSLSPMKGRISIRIDRQPDFFRLLDMRGPSEVLVAEDRGSIVGCISAARVTVRVDGDPEPVYYLGDLRTHPEIRGAGLGVRLARAMHRRLLAAGADLVVWTAADGNRDVLPFFDGRGGLPKPLPLGTFVVRQMIPSHRPLEDSSYEILEEEETAELRCLYDEAYHAHQFGPCFSGVPPAGVQHWVARSGSEMMAAVSLADVGAAKQNVLIRLPLPLALVFAGVRFLRPVIPLPDLPRANSPVRLLYVKLLACRRGNLRALGLLIRKCRNIAYDERYHFLAVGLHTSDPLSRVIAPVPGFSFRSLGFVVALRRGPEALRALCSAVPYEDYSLV